MDIHVKTVEQVTVIELNGEIDGQTAPEVRERISEQVRPGSDIILDLSGVAYMSSAGLRVLLATYREVKAAKGCIVLVALSEEIEDTMSMTGFLRYFVVCETVEQGLAALE